MDASSLAYLVQAHHDLDVVLQKHGRGDEFVKKLMEENGKLRHIVSCMAAALVPLGQKVSEEDSDRIVEQLLKKVK